MAIAEAAAASIYKLNLSDPMDGHGEPENNK